MHQRRLDSSTTKHSEGRLPRAASMGWARSRWPTAWACSCHASGRWPRGLVTLLLGASIINLTVLDTTPFSALVPAAVALVVLVARRHELQPGSRTVPASRLAADVRR